MFSLKLKNRKQDNFIFLAAHAICKSVGSTSHYGRTENTNFNIAKTQNRFEIHKHRKRILIWGFFYFSKVVFVPKLIRKVEIKTFVKCYLNNAVYERVGLFCLSIQLPKINIILLIVCHKVTVFLTYNCEGKKDVR